MVDHAYPTALSGWMVIVPRRHCVALHELTREEFEELGRLQYDCVQALYRYFNCQKEYLMQFAEAAGFGHVHIHVVPRAADLAPEFKGPSIMQLLKPDRPDILPPQTTRIVSEDLRRLFHAHG
jgi:diadenosine tetraphosphate (Ap4A) HIT family hydrolase